MSKPARRPGVLLSVRWGDQDLAHEFLPLNAPRTFTVGTEPGCDFACGGAKSFQLLEIGADGVSLRAPKNATVEWTHRGVAQANPGQQLTLERGDRAQFEFGPLSFEAQVLEAPPRVKRAQGADLMTVNLALVLLAGFGLFAVAAANRAAEGADLDDALDGHSARLVTLIHEQTTRQASAAAAAPRPTKIKPTSASPSRARQLAPSRPSARAPAALVDVGSIFKGIGAAKVFGANGLGNELIAAANGLRTAEAGNGNGNLGGGHQPDGNGMGGLAPEGIGRIGTHGRGENYGRGVILQPIAKFELPPPEVSGEGCALDGSGCLDKELIRRVIRENIGGYRYCYQALLNRFPKLEGKVSVRFVIERSGRSSAPSIASSTANNPELEACLQSRTLLLRFPSRSSGQPVWVTYPFVFHQSGS